MKNNRENIVRLTQLGLLTALIIIMSFTPLGYLRIFALEITFVTVPVAIGAILLGPLGGAILGGIFGFTSFVTCFGASAFGAALLSINPFATFVTCMIPRILAGWLCGLIFKMLKSEKTFSFFIGALACPVLNTVFFMSSLVLFFYNTEYIQSFVSAFGAKNPFTFVLAFVGFQGILEAVVCCLIAGIISKAVHKYFSKA